MLDKENSYACGKEIPIVNSVEEVYNLYKLGIDESKPNRNEYKFLFCWNYNRLSDTSKDKVCSMIKEGV